MFFDRDNFMIGCFKASVEVSVEVSVEWLVWLYSESTL